MYTHFSFVPIDPRLHSPYWQPLPNPFYMQQPELHWQAGIPWNGFYGGPMFAGPMYQGMAQQPQHLDQHYRAPSSGPHRNQRARFRREPQYPFQPEGMGLHQNYQYQDQNSGPRHDPNQRGRFRLQAEPRYTNHLLHESFGTVIGDRSTGFNPGHARIEASKNTGDGKVRRTPSKNHIRDWLQLNIAETQKVGIKSLCVPDPDRLCGI